MHFKTFFFNLTKIDLDDDDFGNYLFFTGRNEKGRTQVSGYWFLIYFSSICACAYYLSEQT